MLFRDAGSVVLPCWSISVCECISGTDVDVFGQLWNIISMKFL